MSVSSSTDHEDDFYDALDDDRDSSTSPRQFLDPTETAVAPEVGGSESLHVTAHGLDALGPVAAREPSRRPNAMTTSHIEEADEDHSDDLHHRTDSIVVQSDLYNQSDSDHPPSLSNCDAVSTSTSAQFHRQGGFTSRSPSSLRQRLSEPSTADRKSIHLRQTLRNSATPSPGLLVKNRTRNGIDTTGKGRPAQTRISLFRSRQPSSVAPTVTHRSSLLFSEARRSSSAVDLLEMARRRKDSRDGDLFMELADAQADDSVVSPRMPRPTTRTDKRRSWHLDLPSSPMHVRRSSANSNLLNNRPSSRQNSIKEASESPHRAAQSRPSAPYLQEDAPGQPMFGQRSRRYSVFPEQPSSSPSRLRESFQSPDVGAYGRRRLSFGVSSQVRRGSFVKQPDLPDESAAESSDPKQAESTDLESQTAETVWDELDDLKSRIKRLELSGKLPPNTSGTVSGESNERPRTATTAPTTVDSSPKMDQRNDVEAPKSIQAPPESTVTTPISSNSYPMLHAALAKAKPLLNPQLYRILEATTNDALQLASITTNSNVFQSSSFPTGATASDRQMRRKTDTLCRNLTDLCIALSEGKHEPLSAVPSPMLANPRANSPSLRHARNSLGPGIASTSRPNSRLDARRSSILGVETAHARDGGQFPFPSSPDQDSPINHTMTLDRRRFSRDSSLLRTQMFRREVATDDDGDDDDYDEPNLNLDRDPTLRPRSRAVTDMGHFRSPKPNSFFPAQQRTPSLRETLEARRANEAAFDSNIELQGSDPRRRRAFDPHAGTPPVVPEEDDGRASQRFFSSSSSPVVPAAFLRGTAKDLHHHQLHFQQQQQQQQNRQRQRVTSFGQFQGRRSNGDLGQPGSTSAYNSAGEGGGGVRLNNGATNGSGTGTAMAGMRRGFVVE